MNHSARPRESGDPVFGSSRFRGNERSLLLQAGDTMNFIEANGVSLRYAVEGSGKPVVLIHEMGGTLESWGLLSPLLASKRGVVRYDTRGAGVSEEIRGGRTVD